MIISFVWLEESEERENCMNDRFMQVFRLIIESIPYPYRLTIACVFIQFWKMKLWMLQTRNFINHFLSSGYPLQRIRYRKFCLFLWHRFWPHACIDNCGFSAPVQKGFPGMSMHLVGLVIILGSYSCYWMLSFFSISNRELYWQPQFSHRYLNLQFSSTFITNTM